MNNTRDLLLGRLIPFILMMFFSVFSFGQNIIKGTVVESKGLTPIANVTVQHSGVKAVTDNSGMYALDVGDIASGVLMFSHADYDIVQKLIDGNSVLDVQMTSRVRLNQYGKEVSRDQLFPEARNGILVLESKDGKSRYWFDNRVLLDGAVYFGDPINPIGNGINLRRVRFALKTIVKEKWFAEIDFDFAENIVELKDAIVKYMFKNGAIKAGQFREAFSMETLTTSRYVPFIERSLSSRFSPSRQLGFAAVKWGNHWHGTAGIHFNEQGDFEEVEFTQDANKDLGKHEGVAFTGRLVVMPIQEPTKVLHIGAAASYRTPTTDEEIVDGYRFSTRSLTSINRKKYIDTDDIFDVDHRTLFGFELAGAYNNVMFQSEYMLNNVYGKDDLYEANFNGGYAQIGWLVFGSKYDYNHMDAEFTQPSLSNDWGGLELVFKYSYVNVNDQDANIFGGAGEGYQFGINYYPNTNVRFMLNYNYLNHDRYATGKGKLDIYRDESGQTYGDITGLGIPAGEAGDDFGFLSARIELDF